MFNPSFIFTIITAIAPVEVKGFEVLVRRKKKKIYLYCFKKYPKTM